MKKKQSFCGIRPVKFDVATVKELLAAPFIHFFAAKLYVSHYCPKGCLKVSDEAPVV